MAVALLHGGVLPSFSGEALPKPLLYTHITTRSQRGSRSRFAEELKKISEAGDITEARAAIEEAAESLPCWGP